MIVSHFWMLLFFSNFINICKLFFHNLFEEKFWVFSCNNVFLQYIILFESDLKVQFAENSDLEVLKLNTETTETQAIMVLIRMDYQF